MAATGLAALHPAAQVVWLIVVGVFAVAALVALVYVATRNPLE